MSEETDTGGKWEFHFPPANIVSEYLLEMEMFVPMLWHEYIERKKEAAFVGQLKIEFERWHSLLRFGLIKPVVVSTSEGENFFIEKYWATIDNCYKLIEDFDDVDFYWFKAQFDYVGSPN